MRELDPRARHESLHVLGGLLESVLVVDEDLFDVGVEMVAQGAQDQVLVAVEQARSGAVARFGLDPLPDPEQRREVALQLGARLAEGVGADDDAAAVRELELAGDRTQLGACLLVLDLARHPAGVVERGEDQVAAGEREVGGDRGALRSLGFAGDLHHDRLALLQDVVDLRPAPRFGILVARLVDDVLDGEEAVLAAAEVDEGGVQGGLEVGDDTAVDVAPRQTALSHFDLVVFEPEIGDDRDTQLLRASGVDQHLSRQANSWMIRSVRLGAGAKAAAKAPAESVASLAVRPPLGKRSGTIRGHVRRLPQGPPALGSGRRDLPGTEDRPPFPDPGRVRHPRRQVL
ncbi:MAG: hypothetical protein R2862_07925 [Thermoanaerobaculia bacterium]